MGFVRYPKRFKQTVLEAPEDSAISATKLQNDINNLVFEAAGSKLLLKQEEVDLAALYAHNRRKHGFGMAKKGLKVRH
eukprot:scaffold5113_cov167-Ochromonas_danica.AAC.3